MPVTLQDIAERTGVTAATVSYVLNGRTDQVGEEMQAKVLQTARRLGYRPNASARAVKSGRHGTVAIVMSPEQHRSTLPPRLLIGIVGELAKHGLNLLLDYVTDEQLTSEATLPCLLRERSCDGMLLNYHAHIPGRLEGLTERFRLPVIWINAERECDSVYPDDFGAGVRAVGSLLAAGHRRIAYVDITYHGAERFDILHFSKPARLEGYRQAMRQAGLPPICVLPENDRDGAREMQRLLHGADRITAAIGYAHLDVDVVALAAARSGLEIPADLSLVAFSGDNMPIGALKVTSMVIPEQQVGHAAVEMLLKKICNPRHALPSRIQPFEFDAGETLAPAREAGGRVVEARQADNGERSENVKSMARRAGFVAVAAICLGVTATSALASTNSFSVAPASPTNPASAMFTLNDIYNKLNTRAAVALRTGAFAEPTGAPTNGTMYTLNDIMALLTNRPPVTRTGVTSVSASGDDAFYLKGGAWPNPRFTIMSSTNVPDASTNCVVDNLTGLIWARNADLYGTTNWSSAFTVIAAFNAANYGGCSDWRLPNVRELLSLVDWKFGSPALSDGTGTNQWTAASGPFFNVANWEYWSSTTATDGGGVEVKMGSGSVQSMTKSSYTYRVWPVRGPQ